jgi:hypothetical protein
MSADNIGGRNAAARVPRRLLLKTIAAGSLLFEPGCGQGLDETEPSVHRRAIARPIDTPITAENRLPGSDAYVLSKPALAAEVEGYASAVSVVAGETLGVFVNVARAQNVRCDVYRVGHYQGLGARLVVACDRVHVSPQPKPTLALDTGLIECHWDGAFMLLVEPSWVTGYYLCKLTNDDGFESYVPFIVRESERTAPFLVQASVTTWQAYNLWGGLSLYLNRLPSDSAYQAVRAYQVSFDRPYAPEADIGSVEHAFVRFIEQMGYDVGYTTNVDVDRAPELLAGRLLFATVGHDEYWSLGERNSVQAARDAGLCLAFFSGNTAFRRIRFDSSSSGVERRVITCYKSASLDPKQDAPDTTTSFSEEPNPRPENELLGVSWQGWSNLQGYSFVVSAPDHWIYEGTGVKANDSLGHVIGNEWDIVSDNGLSPEGLEIVGDSTALNEYGYLARATATVYYPTPNSFVFAAATIGWANGLGNPRMIDARLQRVTENIFLRAGLFPQERVVIPEPRPREVGTSPRSRVLAGTGDIGHQNGDALEARFNGPCGLAASPHGDLFVSETGNHTVRKIAANGRVSTVAGGRGKLGLNTPTGIAVDRHGVVYVCDTYHNRIVRIEPDGTVSVLAGGKQGNSDHRDPLRAEFHLPRGVAVDDAGALFVADFRNDAIRRIDRSGVTTVVEQCGGPTALTVAPDGTLYFLATWAGSVVCVEPNGKRTVLANPGQNYGDEGGPGKTAALRAADGICLTSGGLLFADTGNNRVRALAFDEQSTVSTMLGDGEPGTNVGVGSETELYLPRGLTPFNDGYAVADAANHRIVWFSA